MSTIATIKAENEQRKAREAAINGGATWYVHQFDDDYCMSAVAVTNNPVEPDIEDVVQFPRDPESHGDVISVHLLHDPCIKFAEGLNWDVLAEHTAEEHNNPASRAIDTLLAMVERLQTEKQALVNQLWAIAEQPELWGDGSHDNPHDDRYDPEAALHAINRILTRPEGWMPVAELSMPINRMCCVRYQHKQTGAYVYGFGLMNGDQSMFTLWSFGESRRLYELGYVYTLDAWVLLPAELSRFDEGMDGV